MTVGEKYLGQRVKSQFNDYVGIVTGVPSAVVNGPYACRVRYWFEETQSYSDRLMLSTTLRIAESPEDIESNDSLFWKWCQEVMLEAAVISDDKNWFEEVKGMNGFVKHL